MEARAAFRPAATPSRPPRQVGAAKTLAFELFDQGQSIEDVAAAAVRAVTEGDDGILFDHREAPPETDPSPNPRPLRRQP